MTAVHTARFWIRVAPSAAPPMAGKRLVLTDNSRWLRVIRISTGLVWALASARDTGHPALHTWGSLAAVAYGLAALASLALPLRWVRASVTAISVVGAVVTPLAVLTASGRGQSEVGVVQRLAQLLVHTGTVYLPDPQQRSDYNPYLPAMSVFGLPHQAFDRHPAHGVRGTILSVLGDARIWFALVFLACLFASWLLLRAGAEAERPPLEPRLLVGLLCGPLVAAPLCVSGVDLPMIGLSCLAVACAARGRSTTTGLVTALTCALKWTAWPLLPVVTLLIFMRRGVRQALWTGLLAVGATVATIMPFALHGGRAMLDQVARFPLGMDRVHTPAASPLPGHLLADLGPLGRIGGLALLVVSCGAVALWTIRRPPRTAVHAVNRLAVGLTAAFGFAPSSRFGYFALPLILWLLPHLACGSLQLTIPYWKHGRRSFQVVLTFIPPRPATVG